MKRVVLLVSILAIAAPVMAQDPAKVGPNIYKCIFENEQVRVCEIRFRAGDRIGIHSHPEHFVYVTAPGKMRITPVGGDPAEVEVTTGQVVWFDPVAHSAVNVGITEVRAVAVELKEIGPVERQLMQVGKEWGRAMIDSDTATLDRILADEWKVTAPNGHVLSKAEFLAEMKSGALDFQSSTNEDVQIKVYGDTAIVTGRSKDRVSYKGEDMSGTVQWTDVFVKRDGKWQAVSTHVTRVQ